MRGDSERRSKKKRRWSRGRLTRVAALLLLSLEGLGAPALASADLGAITVEAGGVWRYGEVQPSTGQGDSVSGSLVGAWGTVRYGLTNNFEFEGLGFWEAPATFVHGQVTVPSAAGNVTGALTQDVSRWGGAVGARYIVAGLVWRLPVGLDLGLMHTTATNRDLLNTSNPAGATSFGLTLGDGASNQLLVAPFAGIEWLASDHFRISVMPHLEFLVGGGSTVGLVVPLTLGWSWYLF